MDFISRGLISSGELQRLIEDDGVSGLTSNPSIFEKAISESPDYDEAVHHLTLEGKATDEIYQLLTVEDIQVVADLLRPIYDRTGGPDGFVSLELSAGLAHDTKGTIEEALQLWSLVNRPNSNGRDFPTFKEGSPLLTSIRSKA